HPRASRGDRCLYVEAATSRPAIEPSRGRADHARSRRRHPGQKLSEVLETIREPTQMKRHYLFALVDGGGNVPPELSAARQLLARGHTVTVLAEDSVMEDVRATGAEMIRWLRAPNRKDRRPENDPARDWECTYPWQLVDRIAKTLIVGPAADYAHDVSDAINRRR